jgi:hypothetical protein
MSFPVTRITLGKDIFIGDLARAIDMVAFVTLRTRYLMLATLFLQKVEITRMTTPALMCLKGFNLLVVGRGNLSRLSRNRFHIPHGTQTKGH